MDALINLSTAQEKGRTRDPYKASSSLGMSPDTYSAMFSTMVLRKLHQEAICL